MEIKILMDRTWVAVMSWLRNESRLALEDYAEECRRNCGSQQRPNPVYVMIVPEELDRILLVKYRASKGRPQTTSRIHWGSTNWSTEGSCIQRLNSETHAPKISKATVSPIANGAKTLFASTAAFRTACVRIRVSMASTIMPWYHAFSGASKVAPAEIRKYCSFARQTWKVYLQMAVFWKRTNPH